VSGSAWAIGLGLVLLLLNGYFVAVEIALLAARRGLIEERAETGDRRAVTALAALRELPITFSGAQLGITLASLGLGAVAEPAVAGILKAGLGRTALPEGLATALGYAVALTLVVFLHMVIGEMVPKNLAVARAEDVALRTARSYARYVRALRPLIVALNGAANALVRLVGVQVVDERGLAHTPEELLLVLGQARERGAIEVEQARVLAGILELRDVAAETAMTPRVDLVTVPIEASVADVLATSATSGHTRLPVHDGGIDRVVGLVNVKDVLLAERAPGGAATAGAIMRPIVAVPGSRDLESLLREMVETRVQAALVVDEFGGTAGLVTLEDVLEELVGDIADEFDDEPEMVALGGARWLVPGTMRRDDLHDQLGTDVDDEEVDADTVGGWMVERLGRLLALGDEVVTPQGWRLEVRTLEGRRAGRICVSRPVAPTARAADTSTSR